MACHCKHCHDEQKQEPMHGQEKHPAHGCHSECGCGHEHHHTSSCSCSHGHEHDFSCGCGHDHGHSEGGQKQLFLRMALGVLFLLAGLLLPLPEGVKILLFLASLFVSGYSVFFSAAKNLLKGHVLDEMFLMSAAAIGAFLLGEYAEGVAVMILYQLGEMLQDRAVEKSRASISALMDIRPESAVAERGGQWEKVSPDEVCIGEKILVRPGERVPLDGTVLEGESLLDCSALTGESMPRPVQAGEKIFSGSVNLRGTLQIRVENDSHDSLVNRILEMAEHAAQNKARLDRFITRFARIYTPVVVIAAVLLALIPPLFFGASFRLWAETAFTFLVVSCPCALVISVPLTFFAGIGGASRRGILLKGAHALEMLARAETAVFDKTGTLTQGKFSVTQVHALSCDERELLQYAAAAESMSNHPIALSLREAAGDHLPSVSEAEEIPGLGLCARVNGKRVCIGNEKLMEREKIAVSFKDGESLLHVAMDGEYAGAICIADQLKKEAKEAVEQLKKLGIAKTVMLTGDEEAAARKISFDAGMDAYYARLLPGDKVEKVEGLLQPGKALLFIGDGVNDAPVLARADVGIAMGALGSDAAMEAADVVLMDDDLKKLPLAIALARRTVKIVRQNIIFSLAVKALVMGFALLHLLPMWMAVFADVGVCLLAVLNAMRAGKKA